EDIAILRALPNMTVIAACDADEVARVVAATRDWPGPVYIRLAQGGDPVVSDPAHGYEIGKAILLRPPGDVLFVTTGVLTQRALGAAAALARQQIRAGVLHVHTVKPIDAEAVVAHARTVRLVVTAEEHRVDGGLGSAVLEVLADRLAGRLPVVRRLGLPDAFPEGYGDQEYLLSKYGLDERSLTRVATEL